jgi:hypothetical protein
MPDYGARVVTIFILADERVKTFPRSLPLGIR